MSQTAQYTLVTGAAGGIGRAIVSELIASGYTVIATDCVPAPVDLGAQHYIEANLAQTVEDETYAAHIFSQIQAVLKGEGLKALINNAAIQILGGIDSLTRSDWQQTLNVNLVAPFIWTQALLANMETAEGCVVNISSIHAKLTKKNFVAYATSKAALSAMTRALAVDLGPRIRVNAIEPAAIKTPMLLKTFENNGEQFKALKSYHPSNSIGEPNEIANMVLFMISNKYKFLNGSILSFDGAISSRLHDPL